MVKMKKTQVKNFIGAFLLQFAEIPPDILVADYCNTSVAYMHNIRQKLGIKIISQKKYSVDREKKMTRSIRAGMATLKDAMENKPAPLLVDFLSATTPHTKAGVKKLINTQYSYLIGSGNPAQAQELHKAYAYLSPMYTTTLLHFIVGSVSWGELYWWTIRNKKEYGAFKASFDKARKLHYKK